MFLLQLTRGASSDLRMLITEGKTDRKYLESLAPGSIAARVELVIGIAIGLERCYSQIRFTYDEVWSGLALLDAGAFAVCLSIILYTVVQVHLLTFCFRQVIVFRRVAKRFEVDLLAPELNNIISNPLIRFVLVGLLVMSFSLIIYQVVPYASLQRRVLAGSLFMTLIWIILILVSLMPLFILRSRITVAKAMELSIIRRALRGDKSNLKRSQFGERLEEFRPADLMIYEDRIKNIWEWPFEVHIRRLVIFGLLPPLTWVLAVAVEVIFETFMVS